jgi:hypothetical protein
MCFGAKATAPVSNQSLRNREPPASQNAHRCASSTHFFLKFLSEMGQQNGNVALVFAARHDRFFAVRKIACVAKRLGRVASLLRCVYLDAVMHNRNADAGADRNRFWDRTGAS